MQSSGPLPNLIVKISVNCLRAYFYTKSELRDGNSGELSIALVPPHQVVQVSSIARWLANALAEQNSCSLITEYLDFFLLSFNCYEMPIANPCLTALQSKVII